MTGDHSGGWRDPGERAELVRHARGANFPRPESILRSKFFVAVLALAAVVGVIASLAAWCFLELIFYIQRWVFTDIPKDLGFDHGAPLWWYLPILAFAGLITAFAIVRLPGSGGHIPAEGLNASPTQPSTSRGPARGHRLDRPRPGAGTGGAPDRIGRRAWLPHGPVASPDAPPELGTLLATSGTFAASRSCSALRSSRP